MMACIPTCAHQDVLDEGARRDRGELERERDADEHLDAGALDQLGLLLEERDQGRGVGFLEHAQGCGSNVMATDVPSIA